MTVKEWYWVMELATDVAIEADQRGVVLRSADLPPIPVDPGALRWLESLTGQGCPQREMTFGDGSGPAGAGEAAVGDGSVALAEGSGQGERWERHSWMSTLDRRGWLVRHLWWGDRRMLSCLPLRPPPQVPSGALPSGRIQLSRSALIRCGEVGWELASAGAWAKLLIHDPHLWPLLHRLGMGCQAGEWLRRAPRPWQQGLTQMLPLLRWCRLLGGAEERGSARVGAWNVTDRWFHVQTRRGYGRRQPGQVPCAPRGSADWDPLLPPPGTVASIPLERPDAARLLRTDPPFAAVCEWRRSLREPGPRAMGLRQLSEVLFRSLAIRNHHRAYPSGGSCYPLRAYLAVHECQGLERGVYFYEPAAHRLEMLPADLPSLDRVLRQAAATAGRSAIPQMVMLLTADYGRVRVRYPDLAYSLILKEVGAVMEIVMLAAAVVGLACCPLGSGDEQLISHLLGTSAELEPSVGEMLLNSGATDEAPQTRN
ncbi:MAG: SagB family peptide dehydrogenase [Cyanobium sp.]